MRKYYRKKNIINDDTDESESLHKRNKYKKDKKENNEVLIHKYKKIIKIMFYIIIILSIFIFALFLNLINNNKQDKKRKIYVKYMDFWSNFNLKNFDIHQILKEKYQVVISDNPDYVFFGQFGVKSKNIENIIDCIKIFITVENRDPNFYKTDYAIGLQYINNGDRYFRKPTGINHLSKLYSVYNVIKSKKIDFRKKKFCAWVVTNNKGNARNAFFKQLSKYKIVDSGGRFINNIGYRVSNKIKFLQNYKFSICFENSKQAGYITEKLFDAFEAGTIPIYYGDDTVLELINNKSYIHIKDMKEFDDKIELIKKIDKNDTLYEEIIKEKIVIDDNRYAMEERKYKDFIYHIIEQDKQKAKRFKRNITG